MKSITSVTSALVATAGLMLTPIAVAARNQPSPAAPSYGPEADYPVVVGEPYVIGGVRYTPADTLNYDAVGYAHAGTEGSGISGAHHVLPLPCYVEVTSLDSGRTILVRLDRRGPMNGKQLIELSPAAWAQLGLPAGIDAPVRVRRVNPPEPERAALRMGNRAPERMETPPGLRAALRRRLVVATPSTPDEPPSATLSNGPTRPVINQGMAAARPNPTRTVAPLPPAPIPGAPRSEPVKPAAPKPLPPQPIPSKATAPKLAPKEPAAPTHAATKALVIQVAAFSTRERAEKAAAQVGGKVEPAGKYWRVRIVATTEEQARAALAKAKQSGYAGALILHHD